MARKRSKRSRVTIPVWLYYIAPGLLLVVGLGLAGWSAYALATYTETTGRIHKTGLVVNEATGKTRGSQGYRVAYSAPDGTAHGFDVTTVGWLGFHYDEGETIPVRLNPQNPDQAFLPTFINLWLLPIVCVVLALFAALPVFRRGADEREEDLSAEELMRRGDKGY